MNAFYKQSILLQWLFAIILMVVGFFPLLYVIEISFQQPFFYFLFFMYLPFAQFSVTPFFKLVGIYTYYSPMLLGYMANNAVIDLHSGSSFDYLFVMRNYSKVEFKTRILEFHLSGLLTIIELIENGKIPPTVKIVATSYFFNDRTIKKFGFNIIDASIFYRINLLVNFIDLFWMYSLAKGKMSIPKVWIAKKGAVSGVELVEKKTFIVKILNELGKKKITKTLNASNLIK